VVAVQRYTVPKLDVQVSALFFSRPGPVISASRVIPNSEVQPSLGRPLAANAPNVTINHQTEPAAGLLTVRVNTDPVPRIDGSAGLARPRMYLDSERSAV
jgi:hypothetical protein